MSPADIAIAIGIIGGGILGWLTAGMLIRSFSSIRWKAGDMRASDGGEWN